MTEVNASQEQADQGEPQQEAQTAADLDQVQHGENTGLDGEARETAIDHQTAPALDHKSILSDLMLQTEGASCMSKSEIESVLAVARAKYQSL